MNLLTLRTSIRGNIEDNLKFTLVTQIDFSNVSAVIWFCCIQPEWRQFDCVRLCFPTKSFYRIKTNLSDAVQSCWEWQRLRSKYSVGVWFESKIISNRKLLQFLHDFSYASGKDVLSALNIEYSISEKF